MIIIDWIYNEYFIIHEKLFLEKLLKRDNWWESMKQNLVIIWIFK